MELLPRGMAILLGSLGAFASYIALFYKDKLKGKDDLPKLNFVKILVDIFIILFIGGVWTGLVIEPVSIKQAILSGLTAEVALIKVIGGQA